MRNNVYVIRVSKNEFDVYGTGPDNVDNGERCGLWIKDLGDSFLYEHFHVPSEYRYDTKKRVPLSSLGEAAQLFVTREFRLN